ncbi:TTF-type domain-containing protein [Fagus crenata]
MNNLNSLSDPSLHIDKRIQVQDSKLVLQNRLRLKTTIDCVKWLAMQACAFRGHDESSESSNRGNFYEMLKYTASINENIAEVILENAPGNAKYTSPDIQKEILNILATRVRNKIREEIGDAKFCILVDEALDESNKEQMAIVLRFVNRDGFVQERFFDVVSVDETSAKTLKKGICNVLTRHNLQVENMRGQGYDGASNMRGAWNGLQALFLKDCPYAYYVHCFAHQLQLALVAAAKDVPDVWKFFSKLNSIVNLVGVSPKRHMELKNIKAAELADMLASGELATGKGANQSRSLQRPGATRWGSHFGAVSKLIEMFTAAQTVLESISKNGLNNNIRGEANGAYKSTKSFKFCFLLFLLNEVMGITDCLCQVLQRKSQDIINALDLVSATKCNLQKLRQDGWDAFIGDVTLFCISNKIDMPDMSAHYKEGTGRSCQQNDNITIEHYYRIDLFNAIIDFQLLELDNRFTERTTRLLVLSSALNPLKLYEYDVFHNPKFQNLTSLSELCRRLVETGKVSIYFLIDRLVRLVLTLPVSTATTERAFSAMKLVKTTLRNKMEDGFLADCLVIYIERELARNIDSNSIINDFYSIKNRRAPLK